MTSLRDELHLAFWVQGVLPTLFALSDLKKVHVFSPQSANEARRWGIKLFVIGVGDNLNLNELRGVANDPDDEFLYRVPDFDRLQGLRDTLLTRLCQTVGQCGCWIFFSFFCVISFNLSFKTLLWWPFRTQVWWQKSHWHSAFGRVKTFLFWFPLKYWWRNYVWFCSQNVITFWIDAVFQRPDRVATFWNYQLFFFGHRNSYLCAMFQVLMEARRRGHPLLHLLLLRPKDQPLLLPTHKVSRSEPPKHLQIYASIQHIVTHNVSKTAALMILSSAQVAHTSKRTWHSCSTAVVLWVWKIGKRCWTLSSWLLICWMSGTMPSLLGSFPTETPQVWISGPRITRKGTFLEPCKRWRQNQFKNMCLRTVSPFCWSMESGQRWMI